LDNLAPCEDKFLLPVAGWPANENACDHLMEASRYRHPPAFQRWTGRR
jgi:hypothetical protein